MVNNKIYISYKTPNGPSVNKIYFHPMYRGAAKVFFPNFGKNLQSTTGRMKLVYNLHDFRIF